MPRINPFRKKNVESNDAGGDRKKQNRSFLQKLFFSKSQPSEVLIVEALIEKVSPIWDTVIIPLLVTKFGKGSTLYAIFYAPNSRKNKVILEIWDPNYVDTKPSEVFELEGMHDVIEQLPTNRTKAQILTLENWS